MPVETREITVTGKEDCGIVDITEMVSEEVKNSKIRNGTVKNARKNNLQTMTSTG
ncbi:hypothetical protein MSSAC_1308 [Methanosarcina siciliae C2J]|uniref:Uncharacterized protein n=1 Tax=Methanosarcina siciliae C2J TaxID=1434118 RepID=A0A0E3PM34_9EURY|nr:hypothetical protein [Methanosarcina siciliae]AKB35898.1 hypothetical protein MSSAC_1308 [Methanosarcina siciliae C2J]